VTLDYSQHHCLNVPIFLLKYQYNNNTGTSMEENSLRPASGMPYAVYRNVKPRNTRRSKINTIRDS